MDLPIHLTQYKPTPLCKLLPLFVVIALMLILIPFTLRHETLDPSTTDTLSLAIALLSAFLFIDTFYFHNIENLTHKLNPDRFKEEFIIQTNTFNLKGNNIRNLPKQTKLAYLS